MELLFDLRAAQSNISGKRHGGGRFAEVVFLRIIERNLPVCCFWDSTCWLNPVIQQALDKHHIVCFDIQDKNLQQVIDDYQIKRVYSALPINVFHIENCDVIGTIHGLREFETPLDNNFFRYKGQRMRYVIKFLLQKYIPSIGYIIDYRRDRGYINKKNFRFFTVSNHSLWSFKTYFPECKDKDIKVFYSPSTSSRKPVTSRKYDDKYFLLVSANRWEKNNLRAIEAFDKLVSNGYIQDFKLKVTGASTGKIFRYKIKNPERIDFMGYVDDGDLEQLYHDAYCFIYPSLNEGFGYPPLEAMRYGIPVLASPISSISEVCQGAALYFNPLSVEELMSRILQISYDTQMHEEYSQRAIKEYELITKKQNEDLDKMIDFLYDDLIGTL